MLVACFSLFSLNLNMPNHLGVLALTDPVARLDILGLRALWLVRRGTQLGADERREL